MKKYIKVDWPECQVFMDHPKQEECLLVCAIDDSIPNMDTPSLMVPEDLYKEIMDPIKHYIKIPQSFAIPENYVVIEACSNHDCIFDKIKLKDRTSITTYSGKTFYLKDGMYVDNHTPYNYYIKHILEEA